MGQGTSAEPLTADAGSSFAQHQPNRFSTTLPPGLPNEDKKARYEKEITRLIETWPDGGQDKFRAEYKGNEKVDLNEAMPQYKDLSFDKEQLVYQVHKDGQSQRNFKKVLRSKPDMWRKHGAVKKLHEIGGKSFNGPPGGKPKYYDIKPGTTPPPDPQVKPLLTVDDYKPFGGISGTSAE